MRELLSRGELVAIRAVAGIVLALILVFVVADPPLRSVDGATTIRECRPGERPDTTLCYRPPQTSSPAPSP